MIYVRLLQESTEALGTSLDASETDGRAAFWQVRAVRPNGRDDASGGVELTRCLAAGAAVGPNQFINNVDIQGKIDGWEGKALVEHRPVFYRDWRSVAVILVDGVRRSKKPTGAPAARRPSVPAPTQRG